MDMSNPWRVRWDYLMLVMMVYVIIFTPYYIAFGINTVGGWVVGIAFGINTVGEVGGWLDGWES